MTDTIGRLAEATVRVAKMPQQRQGDSYYSKFLTEDREASVQNTAESKVLIIDEESAIARTMTIIGEAFATESHKAT